LLPGAEVSQIAHNQGGSIMGKGSNQNQGKKECILKFQNSFFLNVFTILVQMTKLAISSWIVSKKMAQMDRKEVKKLRNLQLVAENFKTLYVFYVFLKSIYCFYLFIIFGLKHVFNSRRLLFTDHQSVGLVVNCTSKLH